MGTSDREHLTDCNCDTCMPPGADGAVEDALDAAASEMARQSVRGAYVLRPLAKTSVVRWYGEGSRSDIDRAALATARRCLVARGRYAAVVGSDLYTR